LIYNLKMEAIFPSEILITHLPYYIAQYYNGLSNNYKLNVELYLCLIKHYTIKTYGGVEVQLHHS
jgi:hypothetical protein